MSERLIGYVSDEDDVAIEDARLELERDGESLVVRSRPSGAVWAAAEPGEYQAVVSAPGYGRKRTTVVVGASPHRLRLLSGRPLGYAWPKCVCAGERAELRIHAPEGYTLELWRYGWTRRLERRVGRFDPHPPGALTQILPDGDVASGGARWNDAGTSFALDPRHLVEAPARSGLYYFRLRTVSGGFFSFPWVVAPARPRAEIAVLASDLTWNAYNDFGGRSNYVSPTALPERPTVNARQEPVWFSDPNMPAWAGQECDPLSFDRPERDNCVGADEEVTDPIERRGAEHLGPAEWRLLGWLEREGFDYDLYGETQLAAGALDLSSYRVLVISTHPEYWTRAMYERVKGWVEGGGKLAYLGGNGIDCEVELDGDRMRVLNGDIAAVQSDRERHDTRFALRGESAGALLGVTTTMTGYETGAPFRVVAADHWAFAGLGLRAGDRFGERTLDCRNPGGASGHETDKRSPFAPPGVRLLAKGTNPDDGGAEIVYLETPRGGEVFSVGSISWACAIAVDDGVSRITANVLRRFLGREHCSLSELNADLMDDRS